METLHRTRPGPKAYRHYSQAIQREHEIIESGFAEEATLKKPPVQDKKLDKSKATEASTTQLATYVLFADCLSAVMKDTCQPSNAARKEAGRSSFVFPRR